MKNYEEAQQKFMIKRILFMSGYYTNIKWDNTTNRKNR